MSIAGVLGSRRVVAGGSQRRSQCSIGRSTSPGRLPRIEGVEHRLPRALWIEVIVDDVIKFRGPTTDCHAEGSRNRRHKGSYLRPSRKARRATLRLARTHETKMSRLRPLVKRDSVIDSRLLQFPSVTVTGDRYSVGYSAARQHIALRPTTPEADGA
jgi:hypothetical protein